jgi:hypothetical protein
MEAEEVIRQVLVYCVGTGNQDLWDILYPYIKEDPEIIISRELLKHFSKKLNAKRS